MTPSKWLNTKRSIWELLFGLRAVYLKIPKYLRYLDRNTQMSHLLSQSISHLYQDSQTRTRGTDITCKHSWSHWLNANCLLWRTEIDRHRSSLIVTQMDTLLGLFIQLLTAPSPSSLLTISSRCKEITRDSQHRHSKGFTLPNQKGYGGE